VFTLRAGPRASVGSVHVSGPAGFWLVPLESLAAPSPGAAFRRDAARRAAGRMQRRLVEGGRWRAQVEPRESYDPARAQVALRFEVAPGPLLLLEFRGARPPGSLRGRVEKLLRDGGARSDALDEAVERIERDFRGRGHREVVVTPREQAEPGERLRLILEIQAGPLAQVASVQIAGLPDPPPAFALQTRAGEPLRDRKLEADALALRRALEELGHVEAAVEAEVAEGGGQLPVLFRLRPGPRTLVEELRIEAPEPRPELPLRELRSKPGGPYRVQDLALDRTEILAGYRDAGYLQAEVLPEMTFADDRSRAQLTLRVVPGRQTRVDRIVVAGLEHTREPVVRRELSLEPGAPLGLQQVLESQRRLGALGIFRRVAIAEIDPESPERRSLVVSAEEAPRSTVAYGVGFAERELLRVSAEVTRRNLAGLDRSLTAFVRASVRGNRALLNYREPYLFGRKHELFATAFREEDDREAFDFLRYGGALQVLRPLRPGLSAILRYTYQLTEVFNLEVPIDEVDRQFQNSTFSGPAFSLVNDARDDPLEPRRGHFASGDVQLSLAALGGDGFVKSFFQAAAYRRLDARTLLALGGRLGLARTLGGDAPLRLPLPDRFFAGGDYSLRGFATDSVGPQELTEDGELVPTGGNALLLGNLELRRDLGRHLALAAFLDAGNVYALASQLALDDLRYSAGLGLRYRSALGPVRVDWGVKLNRREGESASHLHVTIGHAF
jgi:outer membrane protein insertion porin family